MRNYQTFRQRTIWEKGLYPVLPLGRAFVHSSDKNISLSQSLEEIAILLLYFTMHFNCIIKIFRKHQPYGSHCPPGATILQRQMQERLRMGLSFAGEPDMLCVFSSCPAHSFFQCSMSKNCTSNKYWRPKMATFTFYKPVPNTPRHRVITRPTGVDGKSQNIGTERRSRTGGAPPEQHPLMSSRACPSSKGNEFL